MLKKERQIQEFLSTFSFLKGEDVILYGTGQYTELLLQASLPFRVIGLMDQMKTGTVCYGQPVLNEDAVRHSGCRYMILVANLSSVPAICRRIEAFVSMCGIIVYSMNGCKSLEEPKNISIPSDRIKSIDELLFKVKYYDVVSFDLFDTLIARKCLMPEQIFSIVERRAREAGIALPVDFVSRRQAAEKSLYHGGCPWYRLDDIYRWLETDCRLSPDTVGRLRQLELDTELDMVIPRADIVDVYHKLLRNGKRVIITSDMYLTSEQLQPFLEKCGLADVELYVSCEQKSSKHMGTMFQSLQKRFSGKKIFHIGDNPHCDVANAQKQGIDGHLIPSANAWMETLRLPKELNPCMRTLFAQRCFSSAFPLDQSGGHIKISTPEDMGYLFYGPMAIGYMAWLVKELTAHQIDRILFISRDGYLFHQLYQKILPLYDRLPKADYFLTSRRCAAAASLKTEADVRFLFDDVCYSRDMPLEDLLEQIYGQAVATDDPFAKRTVGELGSEAAWEHLRCRYLPQILERAKWERARYLRYIDSLDLAGERIGMMNFVGRGVTQKCLHSILKRDLIGFYFALEYDSNQILNGSAAISWYPELLSTHTGRRKLAEQLLLGETVFSAPVGSVLDFSDGGEPIYEKTTKERAALVCRCHTGIHEYLDDVLALRGGLQGLEDTVDTVDEMFGLLVDRRFRLSSETRSGFQFEDRFQKY